MECFRESVSAPFSLRGKEKAAGGKKKTAKGDLRRNKLHIPHPVRRLRRIGLVRSVVPPFPTRIASLDSRGNPAPLTIPLKTTKKGAAAPFLGFSPDLVCAETDSDLQNALQIRIWQTGVVVEILCVCFGRDLNGSSFVRDMHGRACCAAALRLPYVKYSTGANKTTRTAYRALRKPDWAAARKAF